MFKKPTKNGKLNIADKMRKMFKLKKTGSHTDSPTDSHTDSHTDSPTGSYIESSYYDVDLGKERPVLIKSHMKIIRPTKTPLAQTPSNRISDASDVSNFFEYLQRKKYAFYTDDEDDTDTDTEDTGSYFPKTYQK